MRIVLEENLSSVARQELILEPGDSIYFKSSIPHRWENVEMWKPRLFGP